AVMAGAFTKGNAARLAEKLGRTATDGELYIAHFLGSSGAARLISLAASNPAMPAADAFPIAAQANPAIFNGAKGQSRSVADVYAVLVGRYDIARAGASGAFAAAQTGARKPAMRPQAASAPVAVLPAATASAAT